MMSTPGRSVALRRMPDATAIEAQVATTAPKASGMTRKRREFW